MPSTRPPESSPWSRMRDRPRRHRVRFPPPREDGSWDQDEAYFHLVEDGDVHRLSIDGTPLHYFAIVARKRSEYVPEDFAEA